MKKKDWNIDNLIKQIVEEELEKTLPSQVSKEETWENISQALYSKNRNPRTFRKRIQRISVVTIGVLILAVSLFQSPSALAFDWIAKFFLKAQGTITELVGNIGEPNSSHNNVPKPEAQVQHKEVKVEDVSLDEAKKMIDGFSIVIPNQVPQGFSLSHTSVIKVGDRKSNEITLHYRNEEQTFSIHEIYIKEQMGYSSGVDNEDTKIKEVNINGIKGTFFTYKDKTSRVVWVKQNVQFMIDSRLSENEILKIAQSM